MKRYLRLLLILHVGFCSSISFGKEKAKVQYVLDHSAISTATQLEFDLDGEGRSVFVKKDREWYMKEPAMWLANPMAIQHIMNALSYLKVESRIELDQHGTDDEIWGGYGLIEPKLGVGVHTSTGIISLKFGLSNKDAGKLYVATGSQKEVFVIEKSLFSFVFEELGHMRSLKIFSIPASDISSLKIEDLKKGVIVSFSKSGDVWRLESPDGGTASSSKMVNVVRYIADMKLEEFVGKESLSNVDLSAPSIKISIASVNTEEVLVLSSSRPPQNPSLRYARIMGSDLKFIASSVLFDKLAYDWKALLAQQVGEPKP